MLTSQAYKGLSLGKLDNPGHQWGTQVFQIICSIRLMVLNTVYVVHLVVILIWLHIHICIIHIYIYIYIYVLYINAYSRHIYVYVYVCMCLCVCIVTYQGHWQHVMAH